MIYSFNGQLYQDCSAYISIDMEVCQLGVGTEQESAHQMVELELGPYDLVLEESIVEKEVVWCGVEGKPSQ